MSEYYKNNELKSLQNTLQALHNTLQKTKSELHKTNELLELLSDLLSENSIIDLTHTYIDSPEQEYTLWIK